MAGPEFCGVGSRILQRMWDAEIAVFVARVADTGFLRV